MFTSYCCGRVLMFLALSSAVEQSLRLCRVRALRTIEMNVTERVNQSEGENGGPPIPPGYQDGLPIDHPALWAGIDSPSKTSHETPRQPEMPRKRIFPRSAIKHPFWIADFTRLMAAGDFLVMVTEVAPIRTSHREPEQPDQMLVEPIEMKR
jgi:hypothetical protein